MLKAYFSGSQPVSRERFPRVPRNFLKNIVRRFPTPLFFLVNITFRAENQDSK